MWQGEMQRRGICWLLFGEFPPILGEKLAAAAPSFLAVACHALAAGK